MGQPIAVVRKKTSNPAILRFEINRSLTGMGFERYRAGEEITGDRPPDELARRMFASGGITGISIYSNEITVELGPGRTGDGLEDVIASLFIHYTPGVQPSIP
jgi:hypothetical protein